ncbi:MAG: 4Fe-4S binding protein [Spirochaetales bacterium]|nr:4Fe-4S binding protein [Spirochaetales bacterium]
MKTITVLSGKGGTGKSTITAILGKVRESVILADCDVDAANLNFFHKPIQSTTIPFYGKSIAEIDFSICNNCKKCVHHCKYNAIDSRTLIIDPQACEGCSFCEFVCPQHAISMKPHNNGLVFVSKSEDRDIIHADLFPGQDNSGKLVSEVLNHAREKGELLGYETLLCDGPPGIACPVVASINQTDFILAVTEPSESALHDLKRLEELKNFFNLRGGVIINKSDLSEQLNSKIKAYVDESSWEIIGELKMLPEIRQLSMNEKFEISDKIRDIFEDFSKKIDFSINKEIK